MDKKRKILVVDDDQEIGMMLKLILEFNNFEVTVLERTKKVLGTIEKQQIDLVVLDLLIAGTKGTDVCKEIKSNPSLAKTPIIMVTALPNIEQECLDAGANGFMPKPFEMKELVELINTLLG